MWKNEEKEGVSAVIAVILMVAITVVLAGVLYVWVMGMADTGEGGGGSMTAQKSSRGSDTTYNVTLNVASTSGTFRITDTEVVIEDDAGITVATADFSTKSDPDDAMGNAEVYIIDGGTNQNITIIDNDANGNLNANDKVWIESGLAQPGYTIIVKVSGSQVGTWDA